MSPLSTNTVLQAHPTCALGEMPKDARVMGQHKGDACTVSRECRKLGSSLRAQQRQGRQSRAKSPEESFAQCLPPKS